MRTICGCRSGHRFFAGALSALVVATWMFAWIPSAPAEGGKQVGAAKTNVYGCKCMGERFCAVEGATVHCPCGMHQGKWCSCGHSHEGQISGTVTTAAEGDWKNGEKRAFTVVLQWAAVEQVVPGDGGGAMVKFAAGQPFVGTTEGAAVGAELFHRGELWICPMKCEESEINDTCSLCHMEMKKGEGWLVAVVPELAIAQKRTGEYSFEFEPPFSGKALIRVRAEGADGSLAVLDFETEIKE